MREVTMALRKPSSPAFAGAGSEEPPTGPAFRRPEDRLHGCLEGRTGLVVGAAAAEILAVEPAIGNCRALGLEVFSQTVRR
jgi:hypothetical protein